MPSSLLPPSLLKPLPCLPAAPFCSISWAYWKAYSCGLWLSPWNARDQIHSLEWPVSCPERGHASSSTSSTPQSLSSWWQFWQGSPYAAMGKEGCATIFCAFFVNKKFSLMCVSLVSASSFSPMQISPSLPYTSHIPISQLWWCSCSSPTPWSAQWDESGPK